MEHSTAKGDLERPSESQRHIERHVERRIENVIFDFGNVLVDWDPAAALVSRFSTEDIEWFLSDDGGDFSEGNNRTNEGDSLNDVLRDLEAERGPKSAQMFRWYWEHASDAIKGNQLGARQLVEDVKAAGLGAWGLSNWPAPTFDAVYAQFPIFHLMDGMVISGKVRMRKPDPRIFALALHQFGISADSAVFVDDSERNVTAAAGVGIHSIRFDGDPYRVRRQLVRLGVDIPLAW
jgi:putative hydrolase of the HAD superfamily